VSTFDIDLGDFILIVTDKTPPSVWPVMDDPRYRVCEVCWDVPSECDCEFRIVVDGLSHLYSTLGEAKDALEYFNAVTPGHVVISTTFDEHLGRGTS
jgi:hypothetical protein